MFAMMYQYASCAYVTVFVLITMNKHLIEDYSNSAD